MFDAMVVVRGGVIGLLFGGGVGTMSCVFLAVWILTDLCFAVLKKRAHLWILLAPNLQGLGGVRMIAGLRLDEFFGVVQVGRGQH